MEKHDIKTEAAKGVLVHRLVRGAIVALAQMWKGHEGVNYETTSTENLLSLIADAVEYDHKLLAAARAEVERWKQNTIPFLAVHAGVYGKEHYGFDGAMHFTHYDMLAAAGARMIDFTRCGDASAPNAEVSDGGPLTHESTETRTRRSLH